MRKVVDSNFLRSTSLREYLAKSRSNFAVLPDYASMEAYNGKSLATVYNSMAILAEFPHQVAILKGTREICALSGRSAGLQKRLINAVATREFPINCRRLADAKNGDPEYQRQLLDKRSTASDHMEKILVEAAALPDVINEIAKAYTMEELGRLRAGKDFTIEMLNKLCANASRLARTLFDTHPDIRQLPPPEELTNTFIFRAALCDYLLALDWIAEGGANDTKAPKLRNDMIDVMFAAYATFFDGLLSNDKKAQRIYRHARHLLAFIS